MTLREYVDSIRNKLVAIIGIGVSNTPLLELLLAEGIRVTACDKRSREQMGEQAEHLEQLGCELHLGADYLKDLDADVIFRTPGLRPDVPEISACVQKGAVLTSEMEVSSGSARVRSSLSPALTARRRPPPSLPSC